MGLVFRATKTNSKQLVVTLKMWKFKVDKVEHKLGTWKKALGEGVITKAGVSASYRHSGTLFSKSHGSPQSRTPAL